MNEKNIKNTNYILLKYGGRMDKPISRVVFYIKLFEPTELPLFYETYKVGPDDFKNIKEAIMNATLVTKIDTCKEGYYTYLINDSTDVIKYSTESKHDTQKMLSWILQSIRDTTVKAAVQKSLNDISLRIW